MGGCCNLQLWPVHQTSKRLDHASLCTCEYEGCSTCSQMFCSFAPALRTSSTFQVAQEKQMAECARLRSGQSSVTFAKRRSARQVQMGREVKAKLCMQCALGGKRGSNKALDAVHSLR
eukprot:Skav204748  [mRNA]  locus=scaffold1013:115372:115725:- [translate_table: standard]